MNTEQHKVLSLHGRISTRSSLAWNREDVVALLYSHKRRTLICRVHAMTDDEAIDRLYKRFKQKLWEACIIA